MSRIHSPILTLAAALLFAGCGDLGDSPTAPQDDGIPIELTDPIQVIDSLTRAWNEMDRDAMAALLAPDFEFCVQDPSQFPWVLGGCWDRATELEIAAHMFDPAFSGSVPAAQAIEVAFTVLLAEEPTSGTHVVTTDGILTVLTGPNDGWSSDTRLLFTIAMQPDGFLRVRKIQEVPKLAPRGDTPIGLPASTWSEIKASYR